MPDNRESAAPTEPAPSDHPASFPGSDTVSSLGSSSTALVIDFDLASLLTELGIPESGPVDDQQALLNAELEALAVCNAGQAQLTGRVAGFLPAGPALAAWLATASPEHCCDADLPDLAAGYRRLASWAQAQELAAVATLAARAAADNDRIKTDEDGRPDQVPPEAAAQLGLAMAMSQFGATTWTNLAIQLRWQLPSTGMALADGSIDLGRARLIADATAMLPDEAARTVERRVLPDAGQQTSAQLRAALRRAVIAADPEGAEQRRKDAERRAKVSMFPDEDGTATIAGSSLPGVHAAAAMARITAMARALKASGAIGGLDLLRANIFLGLLLGTLPLIPPADGAPPDDPPPADGHDPDGQPPSDDGKPANPPPSQGRASDHDPLPRDDKDHNCPPARGLEPANSQAPGDDCSACGRPPPDNQPTDDAVPTASVPPDRAPADSRDPLLDLLQDEAPGEPGCMWPDPPPGDDDAPGLEYDVPPEPFAAGPFEGAEEEAELADVGPPLPWPRLPAQVPAADAGPRPRSPSPPLGLLDVIVPWSAITGSSSEPGLLGRIGPITAPQSQDLLRLALANASAEWRIVLTDDDGRAQAVERVRFGRGLLAQRAHAIAGTTGVVGRLTLTVRVSHAQSGLRDGRRILPDEALLEPVRRAASRAAARVEAERAAASLLGGGCAHTGGASTYRPPPRIREYIAARDVTCRFPTCRQPAWRADLDHTVPWHRGGPTCGCNLGPECRTHHKIKQLPGWTLEQPRPGFFQWTTPAGQIKSVSPDRYPV